MTKDIAITEPTVTAPFKELFKELTRYYGPDVNLGVHI